MEDIHELSQALEAEYQKQKNATSRPISQIEWFQQSAPEAARWKASKNDLNELLKKKIPANKDSSL